MQGAEISDNLGMAAPNWQINRFSLRSHLALNRLVEWRTRRLGGEERAQSARPGVPAGAASGPRPLSRERRHGGLARWAVSTALEGLLSLDASLARPRTTSGAAILPAGAQTPPRRGRGCGVAGVLRARLPLPRPAAISPKIRAALMTFKWRRFSWAPPADAPRCPAPDRRFHARARPAEHCITDTRPAEPVVS